jgi:hypothetical protein
LVGQDWGTVDYFQKHLGRDVIENATNQKLTKFEVGPANQTDRQSGVFATNAILCLKPGAANAMSAPVKQTWFSACSSLLK